MHSTANETRVSWRQRFGTLTAYGVLAGIGYYGHSVHWNFNGGHAAHGHHADQAAEHGRPKLTVETIRQPVQLASLTQADEVHLKVDDQVIRFPSQEDVAEAKLVITPVLQQRIERTVQAPGEIVYDETRMAQLSVRVPGKVWRVEKRLGQSVEQGEILGLIDAGDVGQAKSEFLKALVHARLSQKNHERIRTLVDIVPERQMRTVAAETENASIELFNAQQGLHNLGLPVQIAEFEGLDQRESVERIRFLGLSEEYVSRLPEQTTTANLIPLVAPFNGVIVGRDVVVGETADPSKTQFVIADVSEMWLVLDVKYEDAAHLSLGETVRFRVDGHQEALETTISWISTASNEATRTLRVRAELPNPLLRRLSDDTDGQRRFRANTFGSGQIVVEATDGALLVPNSALHTHAGQTLVFVQQSPTEFAIRQVQTGIQTNTQTEIRSGLQPTEAVVSTGGHLLKSEWVSAQ